MEEYPLKIHKFQQNGYNIVLDINSGAVHVTDELIYDLLDVFTGDNDDEAIQSLKEKYDEADLRDGLSDLHELMDRQELFAPDLNVPLALKNKPLVKSLCLHVAHDCNLRCQYCFAGTGDFGHDRGLMPVEVGKKAVDFIIANSGHRKHCELDFFGGEPLMNMETVRAVTEYVHQREAETGKIFKLTLTTNGLGLTEEIEKFLNDENISLVLSLDGRKEVHDNMRPMINGKGSYDPVVRNMKRAVASRNYDNYYLRGTFTGYNLDFCADVLSMLEEGFDQLSVEPVVAKDAPYELKEEHLPKLFEEYEKLAKVYLDKQLAGDGFTFFHFNLDLNNGPCVAKRLMGCGAGHEYFAVTPDGDLYPCHQFVGREQYRVGSLDEGILRQDLVQTFRNAHVLNKPKCTDCWARFYCSGGCHANADQFHGDIHKPYEIGCELQKKRLECAIMIQAVLLMAKAEA